ncbi:MAG: TonB-dependent receptor, partial [Bacteroidota bacterium]
IAQYINEAEALAQGFEVSMKVRPIKSLRVVTNFTYQDVTLASSDQIQNDSFVGVQIPNIPDIFFNSSIQYSFSPKLKKDDELSFFWNYFLVDQFSVTYVIDEDNANPANLIPTQHQQDIGVSYTPTQRGFQFSFQVNNITNAELFDNFRVPKPGRNFSIKINYSI